MAVINNFVISNECFMQCVKSGIDMHPSIFNIFNDVYRGYTGFLGVDGNPPYI